MRNQSRESKRRARLEDGLQSRLCESTHLITVVPQDVKQLCIASAKFRGQLIGGLDHHRRMMFFQDCARASKHEKVGALHIALDEVDPRQVL